MTHINLIDKNYNKIIDANDLDFLVRRNIIEIKHNPSPESIKEELKKNSIRYKFYLYSLYDDETIKEDLSEYIVEGGSLSISYKAGMRRRATIDLFMGSSWSLTPTEGFLWKGTKFKIEIGIESELAESIFSAGIFILKDVRMPQDFLKNEITIELVDKFGGLDGTVGGKISDSIYIPRGSVIVDVIKMLLKSNKLLSLCFDKKDPLFPCWMYKEKTPYDMTLTSESSIGELIINLSYIVNLEPFYDVYGRLCFDEINENIVGSSKYSFWDFDIFRDFVEPPLIETNFQTAENIVVVEGANINGNIVTARAENTNPKSATNIFVFESRVCKVIDENIGDVETAKKRADYELFKRSLSPVSVNLSTVLVPSLDVNQTIRTIGKNHVFNKKIFLIDELLISIGGNVKMDIKAKSIEEVGFNGFIQK